MFSLSTRRIGGNQDLAKSKLTNKWGNIGSGCLLEFGAADKRRDKAA